MAEDEDPSAARRITLLCELFEGLERLAPGSVETTERALGLIEGLPAKPDIADFGCGTGAASLLLAEATGGTVTAVDIYLPFLQSLRAKAAARGLNNRVRAVAADMSKPPFPDQSFDLIWSEGALYSIGFEAGLGVMRRLLRRDGWIAVSELAWLTDEPPEEARSVMAGEYPAMMPIPHSLEIVRSSGYEPTGHFVLPRSAWTEDYYGPVGGRLAAFRAEYPSDPDALVVADAMQAEIDLYGRCGDSYGYVFIVARAV